MTYHRNHTRACTLYYFRQLFRKYSRGSCLPCTTAIRAELVTGQGSPVNESQLELVPKLVLRKTPSWRLLGKASLGKGSGTARRPRSVPREEPEARAVGPSDDSHLRGHPRQWPCARAGTRKGSREFPVACIVTATAARLMLSDEPEACAVGSRDDSHFQGLTRRWHRAGAGTRQGSHECRVDVAGRADDPREEPNSCTVGPLDASQPQRQPRQWPWAQTASRHCKGRVESRVRNRHGVGCRDRGINLEGGFVHDEYVED